MSYCTALRFAPIVVGLLCAPAFAQQAPWSAADAPITHQDRVYASEQFSNTVSVTDPVDNRLVGVIRLGDPQPMNFSPLYKGQVLVHGLGFSPDGKTLAVVSIGSNAVSFIDTATNTVKHTTYVGRSPHEAFFTPDGKKVWVTVRGEDYVSVINAVSFAEVSRVKTPGGPAMTIFSPDGKYAYVCSSFNPKTVVFDVASEKQVGEVVQPSAFCPNIAVSPDGKQVWFTLKDVGKTVAFSAAPPFGILKTLDTGPITNHVNFVRTPKGQFAYVSIGGLNTIKVFRTDTFAQVAAIPVGNLPHGVWPSSDGTRVYVGLENDDKLAVIDTDKNVVVANVPIGQAPQALAFVHGAAASSEADAKLDMLGISGKIAGLELGAGGKGLTSVSLFDQGLVQVVQAAATGLAPKRAYFLALSDREDGTGHLQPLSKFLTNPAGAAIVNATGPIRQLVSEATGDNRRWLVIAEVNGDAPGAVVQTPIH
jgi:YVTN family beta-propeller protein